MPGATYLLVLLFTVMLCIRQHGVTAVTDDIYICPRGDMWSLLDLQFSNFNEVAQPLCYRVVNAAQFDEALLACHEDQARIFSFNENEQSFRSSSGEPFLKMLFDNGIAEFWHGVYIKDNRLIMDDFPMTQKQNDIVYVDVMSRTIPWNTTAGEPTGTSPCYQVSVNYTECPQRTTTNTSTPATVRPDSFLPSRRKRSISRLVKHLLEPRFRVASPYRTSSFLLTHSSAASRDGSGRSKRQVFGESSVPLGCEKQPRVGVKSRDCRTSLPFVCVMPALRKDSVSLKPCKW